MRPVTTPRKPPPPFLPVLPAGEMLALLPLEALKYLRQAHGHMGIDNSTIVEIIKRYRDDGEGIREIAKELRISTDTVKVWVKRAVELHLLIPRKADKTLVPKIEKIKLETAQKHAVVANLEEQKAQEDAALAKRIREKAEDILAAITPDKIEEAKLKDLCGSLSQLIEKSRLLLNQSTVNTAHHNIVEYITQLNTMTLEQRLKLAKSRNIKTEVVVPLLDAPEAGPKSDDER